ncbi:MAG: zinc-ribbon domain-containing protein [Ruminococcus sp.]|nr:zinc-ribbon domain-containing protein [Ruminococcus sp.]
MAFITCPECGRKNIPDNILFCPKCGFSIFNYTDHITAKKHQEEINKRNSARIKAEADKIG